MASSRINSFVFCDIEGTGFNAGNEIIEIAFISVHRQAIRDAISEEEMAPRIIDKLVLCVEPDRKIEYLESGLTRKMIQKSGKTIFDENVGKQIELFLERQAQPACLIAHNGSNFDFLVLSRELESVGVTMIDIRCGDSLEAFREVKPGKPRFRGSKPLSPYSLVNLYKEAFGRKPKKSHSAESDAIALMKVVIDAGRKMYRWFDDNAVDELPEYLDRSCPKLNIR